ncbi:MAG: VCBS repeat-containing protein [Demequinaceae bacterium]|nr:VCBS repeat-containing protein [Demequinaceae bacterium]
MGVPIVDAYPTAAASVCRTAAQPGIDAFEDILQSSYGGEANSKWRSCEGDSTPSSYHPRGLALDWPAVASSAEDSAMVAEIFDWLLDTGPTGATHERLRRLGVYQIIWNDEIWTAGTEQLNEYDESWCVQHYAPGTDCLHERHIHFSFSDAGGTKSTSWWQPSYEPYRDDPAHSTNAQAADIIHANPDHDVNGDGRADLLGLSVSGNEAFADTWLSREADFSFDSGVGQVVLVDDYVVNPEPAPFVERVGDRTVEGDFDGNGYADVAILYSDGFGAHIDVGLSTETGFLFEGDTWWSKDGYDLGNVADRIVAGRFNSDEKDDIAVIYSDGVNGSHFDVWLSNADGTGFTLQDGENENPVWGTLAPTYNLDSVDGRMVAGNFDGDPENLDDIATFYEYGDAGVFIHVWSSNGSSFVYDNSWWTVSSGYPGGSVADRMVAGDFNSDGRDDIATFYKYGSSARIHVWLSNGSSFPSLTSWWYASSGYDLNQVADRMVAGDFNEDGRDDIATFYDYGAGARIHVWQASTTGSSFAYQGSEGWWASDNYALENVDNRMVAGDFNNDGTHDFATFYADGNGAHINGWYHNGTGVEFDAADAVVTLSDDFISTPEPASFEERVEGRTVEGDFDGDGDADVAILYSDGSGAHIDVGLSSGSGFSPGVGSWWSDPGYIVENVADRVVAGDFNGDQKDDIAAFYRYSDVGAYVDVWLSTGEGFTFQSGYFDEPGSWWNEDNGYALDAVDGRMVAGDFNADGVDDIATFYDYGSGAQIHVWSSDGLSFDYKGSWWGVTSGYDVEKVANRMVAGDFNNDGRDDIATFYDYGDYPGYEDGDSRIHVWLASTTGTSFQFTGVDGWWASEGDYDLQYMADRVVTGDFNADGFDDIATLYDDETNPVRAHVWLSRHSRFDYAGSDGWWASEPDYALENVDDRMVAGDFDADGSDDFAVFYDDGDGVRIDRWSATPPGLEYQRADGWWYVENGYSSESVDGRTVTGDFDGDRKTDVATLYSDGSFTHIDVGLSTGSGISSGDGSWWSDPDYDLSNVDGRMVAGDFNNDGRDEIATLYDSGSGAQIHVWLASTTDSSFQFTGVGGWWAVSSGYDIEYVANRMVAGDFNADGFDDIATFYDYGDYEGFADGASRIHVWLSDEGTSFQFKGVGGWWNTSSGYDLGEVADRMVAGDFNADGQDDIATFYDYGGEARIHVWLSRGSSFYYTPTDSSGWWASEGGYTLENVDNRMIAGDFDNDGRHDIAALYDDGDGAHLDIWFSTGAGSTFLSPVTWWSVSSGYSAEAMGARFVASE